MNDMKYSVLMSVYVKENPNHVKASIESMINQTVKPDEFVIVKDGPLTAELEKVIDEFKKYDIVKIIELKENVGLGRALNIGINNCANEYIARMDADDISHKYRCEKQLQRFMKNPRLSVVGTSVAEFIDYPSNIVGYRNVPSNHLEIKKYIKTRSPFNHPSVMFKKTDVINAGGYKHLYLNEDYYLWIRMFQNNCEFENINEPLVNMRIDEDTYMRRGGWKHFISHKRLFYYMLKHNIINAFEYIYNNTIRFTVGVAMPNRMRKWVYANVLRD